MKNNLGKLIVLYIPWIASLFCAFSPAISFIIAWLGSFFIFYVTFTDKIRPMPKDRSFAEQIMRPVYIVQIIFAGYMCCTSIFFFLNLYGYQSFENNFTAFVVDQSKLELAAQCQRYYCLGHAAFVSGILVFMNYPIEKKYFIREDRLANLLMLIALISFPLSILFLTLPGLSQFYFQLSSLSFISGTLALAFAIPLKKMANTLICLFLYVFNLYQATISGFKEPVIISVMVLGIFLYPNYKKIVTVTFIPALLLLFVFLPAYVNSFRQNAWSGEETAENASQIALNAALADDEGTTNWDFLVYRLSEIDMFTIYVKSTPNEVDYYGFQLLKQCAIAIVPRIFWPDKPITEDLVMQRVYDAKVVSKNSNVSAKPAFIVDAYLSGGTAGVFMFLFAYGAVAQLIAIQAEKLFGGYVFGTALIFSGLFQIFWRGLSLEFLVNAVFWSYMTMLVIFKLLRSRNILEKI